MSTDTTILRVEIIGLHQGRLVAEINGELIVQDRAYLIRRLGDLRRYGYSEVRIRPNAHATSWRERVVVDESVLVTLIDAAAFVGHARSPIVVDESVLVTLIDAFNRDLPSIDNCQPWGACDTCDEPGIYGEGRPLCAAHLPDDNYYPEGD